MSVHQLGGIALRVAGDGLDAQLIDLPVGLGREHYPVSEFAEKYGLPYILLADPEKEVHMLYDVWKEKNMYGKTVMGTVRTTYLIDETGIICKALGKTLDELFWEE